MPKPKASKVPPKSAQPVSQPASSTASSTPPAWPKFKPPLPVLDLQPTPHPRTTNIITIPSFFPKSLCRDYVAFLQTLSLQTTPGKPKRGEAVRVNDRFQVQDGNFAKVLWEKTGLKEVLCDGEFTELWCVSWQRRPRNIAGLC